MQKRDKSSNKDRILNNTFYLPKHIYQAFSDIQFSSKCIFTCSKAVKRTAFEYKEHMTRPGFIRTYRKKDRKVDINCALLYTESLKW